MDEISVSIVEATETVSVSITPLSGPLITNINITVINYDRFTVTATVDPKGSTLTPVLHYGITTAYGSTVNATEGAISASGTVTFPVTGLSSETTYYFKIVVGANQTTAHSVITAVDGWVRPTTWLAIPNIATDEQVIYMLFAVTNNDVNYIAFRCAGAYTVDWGDGNIENIATNTTANHKFTFALISATTEMTRNGTTYRQSLIKIIPQAGQNLTFFNLQQRHSEISSSKSPSYNTIDVVISAPNISGTSLTLGGSAIFYTMVERVWVKSIGILTSCTYLFSNMFSLQNVPLFNTASVTNFSYFLNQCNLTQLPDFNYTSAADITGFSYQTYTDHSVIMSSSAITTINGAFYRSYKLKSVSLNAINVTVTSNAFTTCYSLESLILTGLTRGIVISSSNMSAAALNAFFTALGTASGAQTIDVRYTPGAATCDTSIATAKGFTVTKV